MAEGLSRASMQWTVDVLSLSFCFSSFIAQASAAILIIITSLHEQTAVMKIKHSLVLIRRGKIYQTDTYLVLNEQDVCDLSNNRCIFCPDQTYRYLNRFLMSKDPLTAG